MSLNPQQENAYNFLVDNFEKGGRFTKDEFERACGWEDGNTTFRTYWSKQFKPLVVEMSRGTFRVSEAFRKMASPDEFGKHVTQNRHLVAANYVTYTHDTVLLFEFFMPLANEADLRVSLDSLFYKDSILTRLNLADPVKLRAMFPKNEGEGDAQHFDRICDWVSNKFGGYSISHVSGRFRAADLMTKREALDAQKSWQRYLVDETTAVVRFIFPCGKPQADKFTSSPSYVDGDENRDLAEVKREAGLVRFFFHLLFVTSIVEAVNGEDEIWLLESGMQSKLHIWRISED